ncbi:hypothetical protein C8N24_3974 [Solirubrobacter pauli]|uniref:Uncharacterized protein n=2 Tax=Solirubrobacter pauli TaxID=166793 RepID=A0A660LG36_9ACTN|nr:hypothetical protein C8N24_3974 [Solirubrobacter pauli]
MAFGKRIRLLWHMRLGVVASLLLAIVASISSVQKISLSPFSLTPRSFEMATATTHVVIDTPSSVMLDLRQDTYSIEGLTNRAVLLGNVLATGPVRSAIARRANVPVERLMIEPPLTSKLPQGRADDVNRKSAGDLVKTTDQYRLNIAANPTVPILDIYAQTPTADSAAALADAAVAELHAYLKQIAASQKTPEADQIRLVDLGKAEGAVINPAIKWQVALLTFVITFGIACATLIFLSRVRQGWAQASRSERLATE